MGILNQKENREVERERSLSRQLELNTCPTSLKNYQENKEKKKKKNCSLVIFVFLLNAGLPEANKS